MVKAEPIRDKEWDQMMKVKSNSDYFAFLAHSKFTTKQPIPAEKVHVVEFFVKP